MSLYIYALIAIGITFAVIMSPRLLIAQRRREPDARAKRHCGMGGGGL